MATAETVMTVYSRWGTEKPDEMETLTSGLERGCWKSAEW